MRNPIFDFLKSLAIVMVVLQHFMMCLGLGMEMMNVWPGKLITMVNMPLFIFISGWFATSLHKKSFRQLVTTRYTSMVRPTIVYSVLSAVICGLLTSTLPNTLTGGLKYLIHSLISSYWFVWVILYCTIATWFTFAICGIWNKDKVSWHIEVLLLVALFAVVCFIPNGSVPHIHYFKAMFPFYIMGYISRCIGFFERLKPHQLQITVLCGLLYMAASFMYKGEWSFYYFGLTTMPTLAYRYGLMIVLALCGIVLLYFLSEYFLSGAKGRRKRVSTIIGKATELGGLTLAIYLIQGVIMAILDCYRDYLQITETWANFTLSLCCTLLFMVLVYCFIKSVQKSKWLSRYLLGK